MPTNRFEMIDTFKYAQITFKCPLVLNVIEAGTNLSVCKGRG